MPLLPCPRTFITFISSNATNLNCLVRRSVLLIFSALCNAASVFSKRSSNCSDSSLFLFKVSECVLFVSSKVLFNSSIFCFNSMISCSECWEGDWKWLGWSGWECGALGVLGRIGWGACCALLWEDFACILCLKEVYLLPSSCCSSGVQSAPFLASMMAASSLFPAKAKNIGLFFLSVSFLFPKHPKNIISYSLICLDE